MTQPQSPQPARYDALLIVSFGGPEKPEDVMPFLQNVTRGRPVPRERLEEVAHHYHAMGGRSPINDQVRQLISALEERLHARGIELPIYWGNRNWHPLLSDATAQLTADGRKRALAFITSAYSSYSGCRQYRENIARAREATPGAPPIDVIRRFFNHPGFLTACVDRVGAAVKALARRVASPPRLVFTAHSIPTSMAAGCSYESQLRANAEYIASRLSESGIATGGWDLVYQSRSGPPQVPWLEPDVLDHLRKLSQEGAPGVVLAPIGFLSDHMEVVYDLDVEAARLAEELSLPMERAGTAGTHPSFVEGIAQLIEERLHGTAPAGAGSLPVLSAECPADCCPPPRRPPPRS